MSFFPVVPLWIVPFNASIAISNVISSSKNIVDFNEYFMSKQRGSTINFKVKNQTNGDLFYIENEDAIEPDVIIPTGYVFKGWNASTCNITDDTTLTTIFAKTYKVIFKDSDGTILSTQTIEEGKSAKGDTYVN